MSKYIRTKDGIYEVEWNNNVEMWCDVKTHKGFILDSMISKEDYILADNLFELCDELVVAYKDCCEKRTYLYSGTIQEFKEGRPNYKNKFFTYYGAIWTDKGLIYVAKMNDEGKLVLI